MTRSSLAQDRRPVIRIAPGIRELLLNSICRHPPEHYAVLAGDLSDPHRVTDCRPMPPMLTADGRMNAAGTHVQLNAPFIEYYLNMELLPAGKYLLGIIHTHPPYMTQLSGGIAGSGQGDIPSIRATLERVAGMGKPWRDFLAPIATIDPSTRIPTFTGWIVRLDQQAPIATDVIFEDEQDHTAANESRDELALFPIEAWMAPYKTLEERVRADQGSSARHKRWMISTINKCMRADLTAKIDALQPKVESANTQRGAANRGRRRKR
jgi:hypothetical protein